MAAEQGGQCACISAFRRSALIRRLYSFIRAAAFFAACSTPPIVCALWFMTTTYWQARPPIVRLSSISLLLLLLLLSKHLLAAPFLLPEFSAHFSHSVKVHFTFLVILQWPFPSFLPAYFYWLTVNFRFHFRFSFWKCSPREGTWFFFINRFELAIFS